MIEKMCVICGTPFKVYPSEADRQCCSRKCGAALRARHGKAGGSAWSAEAKSRRAADESVRAQLAAVQEAGVKAALHLPEGQRGPQNRAALVWVLIDPSGVHHKAVNLCDWARKNRLLFFPPDVPEDAAVLRITSGFRAIAATLRGGRKNSRPATSYKGWTLADLPRPKKPVDDDYSNRL